MALRLNKSVLRKREDAEAPNERPSILLVDDEQDNLDSLSLVLDKAYQLHFAQDGREALRFLQSEQCPSSLGMILSDQRMPNMTGVELLSEARKLHPHAIRIILTGYTDIQAMISSINEGRIYRYLTKPIDPVDLRVTVRQAFEESLRDQGDPELIRRMESEIQVTRERLEHYRSWVPRALHDNPESRKTVEDAGVVLWCELEQGQRVSDEASERLLVLFYDALPAVLARHAGQLEQATNRHFCVFLPNSAEQDDAEAWRHARACTEDLVATMRQVELTAGVSEGVCRLRFGSACGQFSATVVGDRSRRSLGVWGATVVQAQQRAREALAQDVTLVES